MFCLFAVTDFELLANAIMESSASIHSVLTEVVTTGLDCIKWPQPEFQQQTAFAKSWHLFACDFGKVCRYYLQMNSSVAHPHHHTSSLRYKLERTLNFVIEKASQEPAARSKR